MCFEALCLFDTLLLSGHFLRLLRLVSTWCIFWCSWCLLFRMEILPKTKTGDSVVAHRGSSHWLTRWRPVPEVRQGPAALLGVRLPAVEKGKQHKVTRVVGERVADPSLYGLPGNKPVVEDLPPSFHKEMYFKKLLRFILLVVSASPGFSSF